jgi:hypothetical protein
MEVYDVPKVNDDERSSTLKRKCWFIGEGSGTGIGAADI